MSTYVFKAEAAFDATVASSASASAANAAGSSTAGAPTSSQIMKRPSAGVSAEREKTQAKLDVATGLAHFAQGNFEKAAQVLIRLPAPRALGEWIGKVNIVFFVNLLYLITFDQYHDHRLSIPAILRSSGHSRRLLHIRARR